MRFILFALSMLGFSQAYTQAPGVSGRIFDDESGKPFRGASVSLLLQADSSLFRFDIADGEGRFRMPGLPAGNYILSVSAAGFQPFTSAFRIDDMEKSYPEIKLFRADKNLTGVTVISRIPAVIQKGDTTDYNAGRFKVNPDASAEDLLKKMPGISVDQAGTVTAMGEQVKNVTVDGKRFFGDDATAALRNLPADIIEKIQVFDRLSDQSQFTGFDDGSGAKGMNIVTKTGMRNGQFGRIYGGYGTDSRYNAGGNASFFNGDRRITLLGLFNNINQQNFSTEDLLGVTGSGGGRSGGGGNRGGGRMSGGGGSNNFLVGQQNGVSDTKSTGLNFSDKWGNKTEVSGSYFYNHNNTNNDQVSNSQFLVAGNADQFYDENENAVTLNTNHRINLRVDHKFDSSHSLLFTPSYSFQDNSGGNDVVGIKSLADGTPLGANDYDRNSKTHGYNSSNNLIYRYSFPKKGRTFSLNAGFGGNSKTGEIYLESHDQYRAGPAVITDSVRQRTDQDLDGYNYSASISYTEPLGKTSQLQFTYTPSITSTTSDQIVNAFDSNSLKYDLIDTGLSNNFHNRTRIQTAGLSFRKGDRDNMLSFGLNCRSIGMDSRQDYPVEIVVKKQFFRVVPNFMWRKKMASGKSINLNYRVNTNTPSVSQLQNVIDNSNSLFLSTGNPDLDQQVNHSLVFRYSATNAKRASSFFINLYSQLTQNYIATATYTSQSDTVLANDVVMHPGTQLSQPVNLDGFLNARLFLTYGLPVKKFNLNLNGGLTFYRMPGMANGKAGKSDQMTINAGLVFSSNISEYIDFNISYNGAFSSVASNINPSLDSRYVNNMLGAKCNLLNKKGWFINTDLTGQYYSGLSQGYDQSYWLWNAGLGKKFLKNKSGEIKFSVFDILSQNQSIARTVTEISIEDVRNTVLSRYFMLTFSYKLRNFGTPPKTESRGRDWGMPPGSPGGRMPW